MEIKVYVGIYNGYIMSGQLNFINKYYLYIIIECVCDDYLFRAVWTCYIDITDTMGVNVRLMIMLYEYIKLLFENLRCTYAGSVKTAGKKM